MKKYWLNSKVKGNKRMETSSVIIAYIPVLHYGYLKFFESHREVKTLFLIGTDFLHQYRQLQKDIRALSPEMMKTMIETLGRFEWIEILGEAKLQTILRELEGKQVIMPDEEISHELMDRHFPDLEVRFDPVFLRWDRKRSESYQDLHPDVTISKERFDEEMMQKASELAMKSSDWWRQVGAVITKDEKVIAESRNLHVPNDYQQYVDGDPRVNYQSGEMIELSSSIHAESAAIADAAREGIALEGASIYTSTFPCPVCAKLIAHSGIKKLYYREGYASLDGEEVMKSKGVELIKVE